MAKKITEESLRLNIIVNGDQGRKAILDMENAVSSSRQKVAQLEAAMSKLEAQGKTSSAEYGRLNAAVNRENITLEANKQKLEALRRQQSVNTMTMTELRKHINLTRTALAHAVPGTENWKRLNNELQESRTRLKQLEDQSKATGNVVADMTNGWGDVWALGHTAISVAERIYGVVTRATDAFQEYDEAMTDAMKTTYLSKEEVAALGEEFKKMDTRTAQNELMALLRIGGKLGISGQEDLLGFVRAADKINVALSEDLGGDAEAAIAAIGKMVDIFQLKDEFGLEESLLKVGSSVNSLGMASTANEGYIVDFTKRLAGIAPNADISIDKILGLAATLDKYGQTSEMSATAIGQTIMAMFKRTETFAGIAKMRVEEFTQLLNKDVNEAFIRVLEGMKGTDGSLHSVVAAMDEMHLNGQRAAQVLGTLSKNTDELRAQQGLANQSFAEGTSILDEFATKNDSATARMEKSKNAIHNQVVEIGQQLMPVVQGVMDIADVGMGYISKLVGLLVSLKGVIIAVAAAYAALKVAKLADIAIDKLRHFWSAQNRADLALEATMLEGSRKRTIALSVVKNLLAGNLKSAGTAFKVFATSLKTGLGPIGWVVLAVEGLLALFSPLLKIWGDQRRLNKQLEESNKELASSHSSVALEIDKEKSRLSQMASAVLKAKVGSAERAAAINQINTAYGEYLPKLLTEKSSNEEVATALASVNTQLERKIKLQAREKSLSEVNESVDNQTKEVMTGFVEMLEKSIGETSTAAMRSQMNAAVIEYRTAIEAATTEAQKKTARNNLFSTYFDLGGNQKFFRGDKLRALVNGLNTVIDFGKRATETIDQLYGTVDGAGSITSTTTVTTTETGGIGIGGGGSDSEWSLNNDTAHLEAVLALKKKYAAGEIETEKELNAQILQLEIDTLQSRLKVATDADEILQIDGQLQDKLIRQKNARIKAEEDAARKAVKTEAQLQLEQLNEREARAKAAHELEMLQLQNRHNEEIAAAKANGDDLTALAERQAKERADKELLYINELQTILKGLTGDKHTITLDLGNADADVVALQTKVEALLALIAKLNGSESVNYSGGSSQIGSSQNQDGEKKTEFKGMNFLGVNSDDWMSLVEAMKNGTMSANEWATAIQGIGGAAEYAMGLASKWADNQTKLENEQLKKYEKANDKKKKTLEKRLDAGLISESVYNAEIERMDEEMEKKQEELALKQAKRQKALSLIQAIINTAMSVTMALCSVSPPASYVFAAMNAAMGAAEIALIASQPITTGYADGGQVEVKRAQDGKVFKARLSPDRGLVTAPTALVGEDGAEYVIPNDGLRNPSLAPILASIESARRNGTLRSLDFGAVYSPVAATVLGYSEGGLVSAGSSAAIIQSQSLSGDREVAFLLREIARKLDDPVPAQVTMLGKNGIIKKMEEYERYKKRGRV